MLIVHVDELYAGSVNAESFKISFVQLSKNKTFAELKKRLADVATAQV